MEIEVCPVVFTWPYRNPLLNMLTRWFWRKINVNYCRWWFQRFLEFSSQTLGKWSNLTNIYFSNGWFNHQLVINLSNLEMRKHPSSANVAKWSFSLGFFPAQKKCQQPGKGIPHIPPKNESHTSPSKLTWHLKIDIRNLEIPDLETIVLTRLVPHILVMSKWESPLHNHFPGS